jgi:hypothetical protein
MKKITIKTKNVSIFIVSILILFTLFFVSIALNNSKGTHTIQELTMDSQGTIPIAEDNYNKILLVDYSNYATSTNQALYVKYIQEYKALYSSENPAVLCIYINKPGGQGYRCATYTH